MRIRYNSFAGRQTSTPSRLSLSNVAGTNLEVVQRLFLVVLEEFEIVQFKRSDPGLLRRSTTEDLVFDPLKGAIRFGKTP
ncbi:MAG: hypothetical protein IPJ27_00015 [Candidatus Accumulibacter sp.]|uniref:Uncharacterized protein n=1 Tax=Candidatus Accumulibacter proximus TaxID=2954385 RepID=A0A935PTY1_9PROT|nr:hypothetical protein [Candidatus Accumulibacter proximus]